MTSDLYIILASIGGALFFIQIVFFLTIAKWLKSHKKNRYKDFELLDRERNALSIMQNNLKKDISDCKSLSEATIQKIKVMMNHTENETSHIVKHVSEFKNKLEEHVSSLMDEQLKILSKQILAIEKLVKQSKETQGSLSQSIKKAHTLLKLFDNKAPTEDIIRELQADKYSKAKELLKEGKEASLISKKLGMSMSEVLLISSYV